MKRILLFLIVTLTAFLAQAANVGDWTYYLSYRNATQSLPVGDMIYVLYDGNLLSYDRQTEEVRTLTKQDGLNGQHVSFMGYSTAEQCLVLVYSDQNIDLCYADGTVRNLPQIKNANTTGLTVNGMSVSGDLAVLAMGNGVACVDIGRGVLRGYYDLSVNVTAAVCISGRYYASTGTEILTCPSTDNPSDPAAWTKLNDDAAELFTPFANGFYYTVRDGARCGLWRVEGGAGSSQPTLKRLTPQAFSGSFADDRYAIFTNTVYCYIYDATQPAEAETIPIGTYRNHFSRSSDGTFWAAEAQNGLAGYKIVDGAFVATGERIGNEGPARDLCYYLTVAGPRLLVAGGQLDLSDRLHYPGTVMVYENQAWTAFQETGISTVTGVAYRDATRVVEDPADSSHHYVSTAGTGLYEFRSSRFERQYTVSNSPLVSAAGKTNPRYVRVDGLAYDASGNLWMTNNGVDSTICVLKTDGTWGRFGLDAIKKAPNLERTLFDSKGRFWVASRASENNVHEAGILCLDYNGTIDNTDDDVATYRTDVYNQDGESYSFHDGVYDLMEDTDGSIWVGAHTGLFVISNPDDWSNDSFRITQIKVPRNDGSNLADYLLSNVSVSAIAADGAGRKWIGTRYNGLYLVSPDGTEILQHFTSENSQLLSDMVYDIAVSTESGEVFVGTDMGLCSYQSDASEPADQLDKANVKVYPNPVRPEYSGSITVTGLTANADVKVTTANGFVVAAGTSTGGTFIWDGRTTGGERVASGIYYFMVSTADGKKGIAAKVAIVR